MTITQLKESFDVCNAQMAFVFNWQLETYESCGVYYARITIRCLTSEGSMTLFGNFYKCLGAGFNVSHTITSNALVMLVRI